MNAEQLWDLYLESDRTLDIYDEVMAFFSKDLPENSEEDDELDELVLEVQGHHISEKEFQKTLDFVALIKEKHPNIYLETAVYSSPELISYSFFKNDVEKANQFFLDATLNMLRNFEVYLSSFNRMLFFQQEGLLDKVIEDNFEKVLNDEDSIETPEDFSYYKLYKAVQNNYQKNNEENLDDIKSIAKELENFGFEYENVLPFLKFFQIGLFNEAIDFKNVYELANNDVIEVCNILQGKFMKTMLEKDFSFALSAKIWDDFMIYWEENNSELNYFTINKTKFLEHIERYSRGFSYNGELTSSAILWGSVYVYDFLLDFGMITDEVYNEVIKIIKEAKAYFIVKYTCQLWEFTFVHRWMKPSGITQQEFEVEKTIFEKTLTFKDFNFSEFQPIIEEEIKENPELCEYINKGIQLLKKEEKDSVNRMNNLFATPKKNSFFDGYDEDDFFIPPTDLKPIVKDEKEKIGRNDPCHCGSGKKFKKCCMN